MLIPAAIRKDELFTLFSCYMYMDDMIYFNGYPHGNYIPDLNPKENKYQWVIIDPDEDVVLGYLSYTIDMITDAVTGITVYSFDKNNPIVVLDTYNRIKKLIKHYKKLQWTVLDGCPAQGTYDKFLDHIKRQRNLNVNKVTLYNVTKDNYGAYKNAHIYEVYK